LGNNNIIINNIINRTFLYRDIIQIYTVYSISFRLPKKIVYISIKIYTFIMYENIALIDYSRILFGSLSNFETSYYLSSINRRP